MRILHRPRHRSETPTDRAASSGLSASARRPFALGIATVAAAAAITLALTGCQTAGAPTSGPASGGTTSASVPACPGSATPLSELALTDDPAAVEGGTTACLENQGVQPVAEAPTSDLPVTVTDSEGNTVTVEDASRILAIDISGTLAATVWGLGLGDNLVGRDTSTTFPGTADLPVVTSSGHSLNGEAILDLAPTVVLTDTTIGPKEVRQQLRDAGIPVVVITPDRRIDNVDQIIGEVATALGVSSVGEQLSTRVDGELAAVTAQVNEVAARASDRPRVMFLYVRGSAGVYYIFGEGSGADTLIETIGGVDVAGEIGWQGMKPMTAEAIVQAAPDVLLMMTDGLESVDGIDGLIERIPAIASTPAGQHKRVIDMADGDVLSFGPRTPQIVDALARALWAPDSVGAAGSTTRSSPSAE